jgi:DNA-binding XRE family transcriptional regulator
MQRLCQEQIDSMTSTWRAYEVKGRNMTQTVHRTKSFNELRKQIDAEPERRERVEQYKQAMLSELRRELDLTQAVVAERLEVTQENVSQIERSEVDLRISTLSRYVEALGGSLRMTAEFPDGSVELKVGKSGKLARGGGGS